MADAGPVMVLGPTGAEALRSVVAMPEATDEERVEEFYRRTGIRACIGEADGGGA